MPFPEWMTDAACAQVGMDLFFPERNEGAAAKAVCSECPVRDACLEYAIANDEQYGVWGGMSTSARVRLAHENGDFECGDCGQRFSKQGSLTGHRREWHSPGGTVVRKRAAS
jgi:WhiB family redox-sensing transcriptional regulator